MHQVKEKVILKLCIVYNKSILLLRIWTLTNYELNSHKNLPQPNIEIREQQIHITKQLTVDAGIILVMKDVKLSEKRRNISLPRKDIN